MPKVSGTVLNIDQSKFHHWVIWFAGFGESRKPLYLFYIGCLLGFYGLMSTLDVYAIFLVRHDFVYVTAAVHFFAAINFEVNMFVLRLTSTKPLSEMFSLIRNGMFSYKDELDPEQKRIQIEVSDEYNGRVHLFVRMYLVAYSSVLFVSPVLGYFCIPEDSRFYSDEVVNPYIPHIFYTPFDTRKPFNFAMVYLLDVVFWTVMTSSTYSIVTLLTYGMVNLKHDLRQLNYSISQLERRAVHMYRREYGGREAALEDILDKKEFQKCLYSCLRANVQHHHTLIKYKELFHPYVGSAVFTMFSVVGVVIYAALMYLLLQPLPISFKLKYFCMLGSEEFVSYFVSIMGEEVIQESGKLFETLYETPWYNYDEKFKKSLHIMMMNTRKPMKHVSIYLDASMSKQSFGELTRNTYSLLNLMRSRKIER